MMRGTLIYVSIGLALFGAAWLDKQAKANPPTVYVQPQYVAPQYAPAYGVQYPDPAELAAAVKELSAEVRQLREALGIRGADPLTLKAPAPRTVVTDGASLLARQCAGCHSGAAAKGGGHAFDFAALTPADLRSFTTEIATARMPRGPKIDDAARLKLLIACVDPKSPIDPPTAGGASSLKK